ncbi:MerR family transcriptional regulator [Streptomyces sp. NPDC005963]|uniref:MerR family transcriptional regulator n=1 Tax=Streptomyces sp. NPDC005963 TaxID=3156721 RepID=UPI0034002983
MLIGELSERTGVGSRLLRYYEEQGLIVAGRAANGYRDYDEGAVLAVRQVRALLAAGLSTEVIREVLPCVRGERPEVELCVDVRAILGTELTAADERMEELRQRRAALAGLLVEHPR